MGNTEFIYMAQEIVEEYIKEYYKFKMEASESSVERELLNESGVYTVWVCKTLQNNKALLSTDIPDGMYYEVTYNGDENEFYLDAYKKIHNIIIDENNPSILKR